MTPRNQADRTTRLRIVPLGGLGEIGRNMLVLEYGEDLVVIDAGVEFPSSDMLGIDMVIPNISYLVHRADHIRGILITHGHEDHIGALPWVLRDISAPVFAPRMAIEIIRDKLKEHGRLGGSDLRVAVAGTPVKLGAFEAEWFSVCHSIPDAMGIALRTPLGTVIHTGDFKIDNDPIIGEPFDYGRLARLCGNGTLLLMSDSTYADEEGSSASDRLVAESLFRLITEATGRIFVASFASQIARIQIVLDSAAASDRKVALMGRSMQNLVRIARELGHLDVPEGVLVAANEANSLPDRRVVFMTTGSQGEPQSALVRLANGEHQDVKLHPGDTVIISATPIPGNETAVFDTINELARRNIRVITSRGNTVHVHGHAQREELRAILNLTRPRYFIPVHGEFRMLRAHAELAMDQGVLENNVFLITDGQILEIGENGGEVVGEAPAGQIYVHGLGEWDEAGNVLTERQVLSRDGIVNVAVAVNRRAGRVIGTPSMSSIGFVHAKDAEQLAEDTIKQLSAELERSNDDRLELSRLEGLIKSSVGRFLYQRTRRRPLIVPVIIET
ncbi:MAG: ribonuclease J [SAR202 cluster bacterium]|nr:ribonuclease J [SAR202 cluster bacterium]